MSKQVKLLVKAKTEEIAGKLEQNRSYLERFCNPSELTIGTTVSLDEKAMTAVVTGAELILPLQGLINIDEEIARLQKELAKLDKEVERVQKKLSNQGFIAKAPESVIEEEKAKEKDYVEKREAVQARIDELKG
jgi:valyl-tRNA synthetase